MTQLQNIESSNWIQNTLTINTKNGAYPVRYWWNGATAVVAGKDGRKDACISEEALKKDSQRGNINARQNVPHPLGYNYQEKFYDLIECEDSGVSRDSLRMDKGRGKITTEQFVRPSLIAKFDSKVVFFRPHKYRKELYESIGGRADGFAYNFHFSKMRNETWAEGKDNFHSSKMKNEI